MPRDHLGLGRDALGEAFFQHLGDARVELLARALEQRLVRRVLDQRVLEGVGRRRRRAALVEQLGVHQLRQSGVEARFLLQRDAAQQLVGELAPEGGTELRHFLPRVEPVEARHQRVLQRARNGELRERAA